MTTICSLIFGDDYHGLGALVNSLVKSGFKGEMVVGHGGVLPPWTRQLTKLPSNESESRFTVNEEVTLTFRYYDPKDFYGNVKPYMIREIMAEKSGHHVVFFDPDIVVKCSWAFFERWLACGVAVVEDINANMPADHPKRQEWAEYGRGMGYPVRRSLSKYFNSGFVGVPAGEGDVIEKWIGFMGKLVELGYGNELRSIGSLEHTFHDHDQDCLNAALMCSSCRLATVGGEGMDFLPGGYIMSHAICAGAKPWRRKYLWEAIAAQPPNKVDREFWNHVDRPIQVAAGLSLRRKRLALNLAAAIGRFYHRR